MTPNILRYFIVRAGNGIISIATMVVFTRLLSPTEYGAYALAMAIATVVSSVLFQWLNEAVGRFYPMHLDDPDKIMVVASRGFLAAAGTATFLLVGALPFHEVLSMSPAVVGILFLITVMLGRYTLALQVVNAQSKLVSYGLLSWAKNGGGLLVGFILIYNGMGVLGALLGFLAGLVFAVIAFAPKLGILKQLGNCDQGLSLEMFRYGLPLSFNFLAIVVVDVVDRFMIGSLLGVAHVAPYAVAYDLVQQSVGPIMNVIFLATFHLIVKAFESGGDDQARILLHDLGSRLIAVGLPVAVGIGILASDISAIIFGSGYRHDASVFMPWLSAAIFVATFKSYYLDVVFQLRHATKYLGYIAILMAVVNIFLNLLLLKHYGVIAAAWSTFAAFTVGALVSLVFGKSIFSRPNLGSILWRSVVASACMAIVLYIMPSSFGIVSLLAKLALSIVTYSAMAWVLNVAGCRRLFKV